jgi:hypothetical protein
MIRPAFLTLVGCRLSNIVASPRHGSCANACSLLTATVFTDDLVRVSVNDITWEPIEASNSTKVAPVIFWTTSVNGKELANGNLSVADADFLLPSSIDVGTVPVAARGRVTITVTLELNGKVTTIERSLQSFPAGVAIIPLILVLILAMTTQMVEFSLFACVFVGSCIVEGEVNNGFKRTLDKYLLVRTSLSSSGQRC